MSAIDVTDRILQQYAEKRPDDLKRRSEEPPPDLHPKAAEMFVYMAEHAVYQINGGDGNSDYDDYTVPVTGLALTYCLVACERSAVPPSFESPSRPDPWVHAAFSRQLMAELNREQAARLQYGIWRCWLDPQSGDVHHRITRRRRKSALALLDRLAQPALLSHLLGRPLQNLSPDEVYHVMAEHPEVLTFITKTDSVGWSTFESAMGVSLLELSALIGFLVFLKFAADTVRHSYWYDEALLVRLWNIYIQAYPQYRSIGADSILHAVRVFSMAPSEAASYLIHPPFFRLHERFLRNPCFLGAHTLVAGLLTIAIRKNERAWNETLGSSLARAADTLAALLPQLSRLKVAVRRKYPGGDVDLALYDTQTRELLVCEVKTVYDKHRVDSLINRFEDAKVNVQKAMSQLRATEGAIMRGELTLKQLFGISDPRPARVNLALLTWFDTTDVTMDTPHEDIICLNFATFLWLAHASVGNVQSLASAARELRNLWTVAVTRQLELGQPTLNADLEVQTGLLDARTYLSLLPLSTLTRQILDHMQTIDDVPAETEMPKWISYLDDSRRALQPANA